MSVIRRVRVAAIGTEADMIRLDRVLLNNCGWLDESDDRPPLSLSELQKTIMDSAGKATGGLNSFLYEMISPRPYGEAGAGASFEQYPLPQGLWLTGFSYESTCPLQAEDWLRLHKDCEKLPLFIIHASDDLALEKGSLRISNGEISECWDQMAEIWFWLCDEYGSGRDPDAAAHHLAHLTRMLEQEDWDQTVDEVLHSCIRNLTEIERAQSVITADTLQAAHDQGDWDRLLQMQELLASSYLWKTANNAKWLACLRENADALNQQ